MSAEKRSSTRGKRPPIITVLCILYWLRLLGLAAFALVSVLLAHSLNLEQYFATVPDPPAAIGREDLWPILRANFRFCGRVNVEIIVMIILGIAGWGLWRMRNWARRLAIAGSGLAVVLIILSFLSGGVRNNEVVGFLFHGGVLAVLLTRRARALFLPPAAPKVAP